MRRVVGLVLMTAVLAIQSGCAGGTAAKRYQFPPSEDVRARLADVQVTAAPTEPTFQFEGPAKGAGGGARRGAGMGATGTMAAGAAAGGYGVLAGIVLAPVGALVGAIVGAAKAAPAEKVEQQERAVRDALQALKIEEGASACAEEAMRRQTPQTRIAAASSETASTIFEVAVERLGLTGPWTINPSLSFIMTERARLVRASDGAEIYSYRTVYLSRSRPLEEWLAADESALREEATRACHELAERLVDDVFLVYRPGGRP
ncbi:MAG TPA: hypothetical protein VL086_14120 [Candidatus Nitrosotalea sp.]|nr:hypothetical protein [Candidatus Nitrosotalea sp.]